MFLGILRFEWRYQVRRFTFAAVAAFFALMGFALAATGFGPNDVHLNSPYSIAQSVGFASLLAILAATFFCAVGALRDPEHRMAEIVYTTAISRRKYVFGRYAGVVAALVTAFAFVFPGLLAGTYLVAHEPGQVGPFSLAAYVWPALLLAVPNLLFVSALLFALALTTRSSIATYVGGVLLYVLYFVAALFSGSPIMASASPPSAAVREIAAVADPFGLSAFYEQTRYWTAGERDLRLLLLDGNFLANRSLVLGLTALLLFAVYRRFQFRLPSPSGKRSRAAGITETSESLAISPLPPLRPVHPSAGSRAALPALLSAARLEIRHALRSWPFLALLVGWVAMTGIELSQNFRHAELDSLLLPTTGLILGDLGQPLTLFGLLMLVYYAAELVWRERSAGMEEIVDATPVPNGVLLAAKVAALGALVGVLTGVAITSAVTFQLVSGWSRFEPGLYVSLFLFVGLPLFFVAVLTVLVQTLVPNRYLGILASAVLVLFWNRGSLGGPGHPLLRFAASPEVPYSDLSGFGPDTLSFAWLNLYWGAFVLVLLALAAGLWRRGTDPRLLGRGGRLAGLRTNWSRPARGLAAVAALAGVVLGILVFQQTNRWNAYRTPEEVEAWQARYERTYRRLETMPQPTPVVARLEVDLQPESRRYGVRGSYVLENRTAAPIADLWVMTRRDLTRVELRAGGRLPVEKSTEFGAYRFALSPPLLPGGRTTLDFEVAVARLGATAGAAESDIVGNGSLLFSLYSLPTIGYRRSYEIDDPDARHRQGLPPVVRLATLESADSASLADGAPVPMTFDMTVTTAPDQIAVAPGTLVASGTRNGRRFFRYRSERATSPLVAFASGRYAVARRMHSGVSVEVYHHPSHGRNVEAMLDAAIRTLDYCKAQFGPYPHRELRIVEVPSSSPLRRMGSGFALPGTILIGEDRGFLTDRSDAERVDVVTKRIAHEAAHQWWGHQVSPAQLPGASALVESLARYTEMRVLAGLHGEAAVPPVLSFELDRYLQGRTGEKEAPLIEVENQAYVYYSKGGMVLAAVRDLIGEGATNAALRRLLADVRAGRQPVARDLLKYLQAEAKEADRGLIAEWLGGMVLYDLAVEEARATPAAPGRKRLELTLEARKSDRGPEHEVPLPMDEELEVAVYADDPGVSGRGGPPLQTRRVRVRGEEKVVLDVDARARFVLLDPNLLRIDRNRADNLRAITKAAGGRGTAPGSGLDQ